MRDGYDAIVLMGPPGSGKSFLGNRLHERGVASYRELEPVLRERFGVGEEFRARMQEAGAWIWQSYRDQLRESELTVAIESAGIADGPILEALQRRCRVAFVHVRTQRSVCIHRVLSRPSEMHISHTTSRDALGRHYDLWNDRVLPRYDFALSVDGTDTEEAISAIEGLLRRA